MSAPSNPLVVTVGGGHGAAASLAAIRRYTDRLSAVISVADDGGSSGRLRADLPDLPAPGDIRRCIGALAAHDSVLAEHLEHRFADDGPLQGHAYGNLLIAALSFGLGSFPAAVAEVSRMTGAVGAVHPATAEAVVLACRPDGAPEGTRILGQVAVAGTPGGRHVFLEPASPTSPPEAAAAILAADQVVLGPGSLFTSVLAAAVVPAIHDALRRTSAQRVHVANLRAQQPETAGFALADHVRALLDHDVPVDVVLADPIAAGRVDAATVPGTEVPLVVRSVADDRGLVHEPARLGAALAELLATFGHRGAA